MSEQLRTPEESFVSTATEVGLRSLVILEKDKTPEELQFRDSGVRERNIYSFVDKKAFVMDGYRGLAIRHSYHKTESSIEDTLEVEMGYPIDPQLARSGDKAGSKVKLAILSDGTFEIQEITKMIVGMGRKVTELDLVGLDQPKEAAKVLNEFSSLLDVIAKSGHNSPDLEMTVTNGEIDTRQSRRKRVAQKFKGLFKNFFIEEASSFRDGHSER